MTSKVILLKAHAKCAQKNNNDALKPAEQRSVKKQELLKTPCKSKQTPVHRRNVTRYQTKSVTTLRKHSSCQNLEVIHNDQTTPCKKAKSHHDLTTLLPNDIRIFGETEIMGENSKDSDHVQIGIFGKRVIKEACIAFLLNAWRHRRQEVVDIKKKITALENQATDLRIQIMSLWQLLESEKARLAQANLRAMEQHVLAEDAIVNNKSLASINETQQKEITEINKEMYSLKTECNNQKNELIVAKQELFSLHNQMDKERIKVAKLREDKKILLDKTHSAEAEVKKKTALLYQNETEQKERQNTQLALLQNLQEKNLMVEELNKEKETLQSEIDDQSRTNEILKEQLLELQKIVVAKEKEIEALTKTSRSYMIEAVRMKLASIEIHSYAFDTKLSWPLKASKWLATTLFMTMLSALQTAAFP